MDVYDLLLHGIRGDLKNLENGDTLLVPPVGPQVAVDGMVRRPAVYELRGETNLAEALDLAGGVLPAAALRHIEVQRLEAHEKRTMLSVNLDVTRIPRPFAANSRRLGCVMATKCTFSPSHLQHVLRSISKAIVLRPGRYASLQACASPT